MRSILLATLLAFSVTGFGQGSTNSEAVKCAECLFNFGKVVQGMVVEHEYRLRNDGDQPFRIASVQLTPPLQLAKLPAEVPARSSVPLKLTLNTSKVAGEYSGQLVVVTNEQSGSPRVFSLQGTITPAIEVLPRPAFFISTPKGAAKSASLDIVNHESKPLELQILTPAASHYKAELQTIKPGELYRLTVTVPATAPVGKSSERLELKSSSTAKPVVYIGLNTLVRERVYTFPDGVDFGQLKISELKSPKSQAVATQTLMVYQSGGRDFVVKADSIVPGLRLDAEPGPQGDRVQITASLDHSSVVPGPFRGTIRLVTNDPEFPELSVPVSGEVLGAP